MATFSTWTAAEAAIKDEIADGNFRVGSVTVGGKQLNYRKPDDLIRIYNFIKAQAAMENGTVRTRVYAKQGGRC